MSFSHGDRLGRLQRVGAALTAVCLATSPSAASMLGGWVYVDRNNDGQLAFADQPSPELVISGVEVRLFLQTGSTETLVSSLTTNNQGRFVFSGLADGVYSLYQTHPADYVDGLDTPGVLRRFADGLPVVGAPAITTVADGFRNITLSSGTFGDMFLFGERGMRSGAVSKRYLLASAPLMPQSIPELIPEPSAALLAVAGLAAARRRRR
jgi:hypothetical protein